MEAHAARQQLGLPLDVPMLLFGAIHGGQDPRKGLDLLLDALTHLRDDPRAHGLQVVVFGQRSPKVPFDVGFPMHYMGHVHDDQRLRALYNAVDALVVPSRQDNLPNTGVEAHACGTPVVGFDVGGLSDIIRHETTGYLAAPFDTVSLANGILWTLQSDRQVLSAATRQRALQCFSPPVVAAKYLEVFQSVLAFK